MKRSCAVLLAACAAVSLAAAPARANDQSAELAVGGLVFTRNAEVALQSEDLTITPDTVTVRYVLLNQSPAPVTLTAAFPLPDIDLSDGAEVAFPAADPVNFMGFSTRVDGRPATFTGSQRAALEGRDVTGTLRAMGIALLPIGERQPRIGELPSEVRERALNAGLLQQAGTNERGEPLYDPTWTLKTSFMRRQTFPPGKPVVIEHRYATSVGVSFDTVLRQGLRRNRALEGEVQRYKANYCIGDDFLKSVDRLGGRDEANKAGLTERRISYVLSAAVGPAGPVRDFHLVVDKGRPDRLISFCGDGVRKISATAFEMRAADYMPARDLNILIVGGR